MQEGQIGIAATCDIPALSIADSLLGSRSVAPSIFIAGSRWTASKRLAATADSIAAVTGLPARPMMSAGLLAVPCGLSINGWLMAIAVGVFCTVDRARLTRSSCVPQTGRFNDMRVLWRVFVLLGSRGVCGLEMIDHHAAKL